MKNQYRSIIAKFFLGVATEHEKDKISKLPEVDVMMKHQWEISHNSKFSNLDAKRLFHQTNNKINSIKKTRILHLVLKIAASLILFFAMGASYYYLSHTKQTTEIVSISSPNGQRTSTVLPDGSTIILAGNSEISYKSDFGEKTRNVQLKGEAFFEVQKDADKPFVVFIENMTISVLGTSFNVLSYPEDEVIATSLVTGEIRVEFLNNPKNKGVVLHPGEMLAYSKKSSTISIKGFDIKKTTSWIDEKLIFENENIFSIANKLERWYGIEISVHNNSNDKYTLTIQNNTLVEVLDLLAKVGPIRYEINNNKVDVYITK